MQTETLGRCLLPLALFMEVVSRPNHLFFYKVPVRFRPSHLVGYE